MLLRLLTRSSVRLDAVQDLIDHPAFKAEFSEVAKGLGDLERVVSRIHAKNCKVKDFLKALDVRTRLICLTLKGIKTDCVSQAFKALGKGFSALADTAKDFKSKTVFGLLESAPKLMPHVKSMKAMFELREDSKL